MPLHYELCATCDRPIARYRGHHLYFCTRKCYFAFQRMLKACIRNKELRALIRSKASELDRLAA